jgi:two-component system chemotaxis response regulator CheY
MIDFRIPVLVVDSDFDARQALCGMLRRIGFSEITQDDGSRALLLLGARAFGLVLSDMVTAPLGGLDLLRAVRRIPRLAGIRFIITASIGDATWVRAANDAGVDGYLLKPFDADRLRRVVFATLGREQSLVPVAGGNETRVARPTRAARAARIAEQDDHPTMPSQDNRPMMSIHEDAVELYRRYGRLEARPGGEFPPWEIAFMEWWSFMHHREILVALRNLPDELP